MIGLKIDPLDVIRAFAVFYAIIGLFASIGTLVSQSMELIMLLWASLIVRHILAISYVILKKLESIKKSLKGVGHLD